MAETTHLRLALAQIDPTVGDIEGNSRLISESIDMARDRGAQLVLLPELCLSGYPPEDLVLRRDFLDAVGEALDALAAEVEGVVALVGFPERMERPASELEDFDPLIDAFPPRPTTRSPFSPAARCARSTASAICPTTGSSTSAATSSRARSRP